MEIKEWLPNKLEEMKKSSLIKKEIVLSDGSSPMLNYSPIPNYMTTQEYQQTELMILLNSMITNINSSIIQANHPLKFIGNQVDSRS